MRGFAIRTARGLNRLMGRSGKVFAERYHMHVLKTPREVRAARAYVLQNARRHAAQGGVSYPAARVGSLCVWTLLRWVESGCSLSEFW